MSIGIKGKFIVGFDGVEHRLLRDDLVVIEGKRVKKAGKPYLGQVDR